MGRYSCLSPNGMVFAYLQAANHIIRINKKLIKKTINCGMMSYYNKLPKNPNVFMVTHTN
jgi:hypothetical protein